MLVKTKIKKDWFFRDDKLPAGYFSSKHQFQINWTETDSNESLIRESLKLEPIVVIETMFPLIETRKIVVQDLNISPIGDVGRGDHSFGLFAEGKVDGFIRLTGFEVKEYGMLDPMGHDLDDKYDDITLLNEINESKYSLELHDYNRFNGKFSLVGSFIGDSNDYDLTLYNDFNVKAVVWGVHRNSIVPVWIEYLVDAALNYQAKDHKMASLNYYSAYENFVSIIHDQLIFNYLAKKNRKTDIEITELRKFAQSRKKLSAKATAVAKFLDVFNGQLKSVINKLDTYSEKRNMIAHGSASDINYDVTDMAYLILVYMFCIGKRDNVIENDWKKMISRKNI